MKNINKNLDNIMMRKIISRISLNQSVETTLDYGLYLPMLRTLVSSIKSNLKRQLES